MRAGTLGDLLADAGNADPERWTRRGGQLGGIFGIVAFLEGA